MNTRDLFYKNVWLFLINAKMILENESLFYTPVADGALPFVNRDEFQYAILGVYVEWWLRYAYASRDVHGNPVVYFIGSPMTGSHSCRSIAPDGNVIEKCHLNVSWLTTMKTYYEVDSIYRNKKGKIEAMSIDKAIDYIIGHTSEEERKLSALESRTMELEGWNQFILKKEENINKQMDNMRIDFLRLILSHHQKEVKELLDQMHVCEVLGEQYRKSSLPVLSRLKRSLKSGQMSSKEYQMEVGKIRKRQKRLNFDIFRCGSELEWRIFSKYHIHTTIYEVIELLNDSEQVSSFDTNQKAKETLV